MRWIIVLLLLLSTTPAHAERVHGVLAYPVKDKRVIALLHELCRKGNIRVPVKLYRSASLPTGAFIARVSEPSLHAAIVVSDTALRTLSRLAIAGLLGHELGHLAYGHVTDEDWDQLGDRERKIRQHQADAFAIRIAGRYAVYVLLRTQGATPDCIRYIDFIDAALNQRTIEYDPDKAP